MREHLIIITRGREDGGMAATSGASLALSMQAMDCKVAIFLTMAGTRWAFEGTGEDVHLQGHLVLEEYLKAFLEAEGELLVCAPCVGAYCHLPGLEERLIQQRLRRGARYAGLAVVAERLLRCEASVF